MDNVTRHRKTGDKRYITLNWKHKLDDDQTISTVTWTPESANVTLTALTSAISGQQTSARFETLVAGRYRVDVVIAPAGPVEEVHEAFYLVVEDPPAA